MDRNMVEKGRTVKFVLLNPHWPLSYVQFQGKANGSKQSSNNEAGLDSLILVVHILKSKIPGGPGGEMQRGKSGVRACCCDCLFGRGAEVTSLLSKEGSELRM